MALEVKQVLEYLGFNPEKIQSIDDLKPEFEGQFVRTSTINQDSPFIQPILGRVYGTQESELKKLAKEVDPDFDFDAEDFKSLKKVTDKTKFIVSKIAEKKQSAYEELKKQSSQGGDEKAKAFETKYEQAKRKAEELETLHTALKGDYENLKTSSDQKVKTVTLDVLKNESLGKIKYKSTATELEKEGFLARLNNNYKYDLDENGKAYPTGLDGKKIPSTKVAGEYKTMDEVFLEEAVKGNIYELNSQGGKPVETGSTYTPPAQTPGSTERKLAPRMQ